MIYITVKIIIKYLCCRILPDKFVKLKKDIVELFPTLDGDFLYTPYYCSLVTNEKISAQGSLYNTYKRIRKKLRLSGLLCSEVDEIADPEEIPANIQNYTSLINKKNSVRTPS